MRPKLSGKLTYIIKSMVLVSKFGSVHFVILKKIGDSATDAV